MRSVSTVKGIFQSRFDTHGLHVRPAQDHYRDLCASPLISLISDQHSSDSHRMKLLPRSEPARKLLALYNVMLLVQLSTVSSLSGRTFPLANNTLNDINLAATRSGIICPFESSYGPSGMSLRVSYASSKSVTLLSSTRKII